MKLANLLLQLEVPLRHTRQPITLAQLLYTKLTNLQQHLGLPLGLLVEQPHLTRVQ